MQRLATSLFRRAVASGVAARTLSGAPYAPRAYPSLAAARDCLEGLAAQGAGGGAVSLDLGSDGLAVVRLCHAARANALSPRMMLQFHDAVVELEAWTAGRGVLVAGEGGRFCAGADLAAAPLRDPASGAAMSAVMTDATQRLAALPLLSVAALEGGAVGGGAEIALAADFRVAAPDAFLHFVHVERGVVPGWGGLARLAALAGRRTALYLIASAARVDARHAAAFGLVDAINAPDAEATTERHARAFLAPLLRGPAGEAAAVAAAKRALASADVPAAEAAAFRALWGAPAQLAAVDAWRSGRA